MGCALASLLLCVCFQIPPKAFGETPSPQTVQDANSLFGLTNVWTLHLTVSADDWKKMEPEMPARGRFPAGQPRGPGAVPPPRMHLDFQYVPASLEFEGKSYEKIALRFKGNSSYRSSSRWLKRPLKIDFNKYCRKAERRRRTEGGVLPDGRRGAH